MKAADGTDGIREIRNKRGRIAVSVAAVGEHRDCSSPEFFKISSSPSSSFRRCSHNSGYFSPIDDVPVISEMSSSWFSRRDARGDPIAFSRMVSLTDVVMTFLLRAARSGPVRPFVESKLDRGPCLLLLLLLFHRRR